MKKFLKTYQSWISFGAIIAAIAVAIWMLAGCASHPPTAFESRMYDITTNRTPVLVTQTNVVTLTNTIGVPVYTTNVITSTNYNEAYVYKPGAGAAEVRQVGTEVGNIFGVGGLVGTALGGLFSLWGFLRSNKSNATAVNLAQSIEGIREFVKALPSGPVYDNALVQFLQQHQADTDTIKNVISILEKNVSSSDAKIAAQQIIAAITALNPSSIPPGTVVKM